MIVYKRSGDNFTRIDGITSPGGLSRAVDFSPDGRLIAISASSPASRQSQIYVANADGSNVVNITNTGRAVPDFGIIVLGLVVLVPLILPLAHWAVRFENPPKMLSGSPGLVQVLAAAALTGGGLLTLTVTGLGLGLGPLLGLLMVLAGVVLTRSPGRRPA
jgi:hypothetical protein